MRQPGKQKGQSAQVLPSDKNSPERTDHRRQNRLH